MTLEGRVKSALFLGVQPCFLGFQMVVESKRTVVFSACGKWKETDGKTRFCSDSVAIFRDYSATLPISPRLL
ncbi:hypothetical protein N8V77_24640, partial [Enterobacter hormaechei subsp. xiangfangensis]|nr:hypothetical protein [Enterobacter hormaechei subsp. xiangfangensis]